jgi:uncharacterized protein (TIGR03083 family)
VTGESAVSGESSSTPWSALGREAMTALAETWGSLAEVCRELGPEHWLVPTECPGWSVQDQLSHLIGIERSLLGEAAPDWDEPLGVHVRTEFAEDNERWIAARRSRPGADVLAEFVAVTELRLATLEGLTEKEWGHVGPTIIGAVAYADFMRTRVFDSWVHEQDVRYALGRPGGSGGLASAIGVGQVQAAMGFVVGKRAAAPEGSVVRFVVSGPAHDARVITLAVEGGRARPAPEGAIPTVVLAMSSIDFVRLGCGRVGAGEGGAGEGGAGEGGSTGEGGAAASVDVGGDAALGKSILEAMNFMF